MTSGKALANLEGGSPDERPHVIEHMYARLLEYALAAVVTNAATQIGRPVNLDLQKLLLMTDGCSDRSPVFKRLFLHLPNNGRIGNFWHNRCQGGTIVDATLREAMQQTVARFCPRAVEQGLYTRVQALYWVQMIHDLPSYMIHGTVYVELTDSKLFPKPFVMASSNEDIDMIETILELTKPSAPSFIQLNNFV